MALLNLPRQTCYNQENIIICGLILGPKEPSHNITSFLEPLVTVLQTLWKGTEIHLPSGTTVIKAALLCVSCDSPAMRKTANFLAHNALKGCFKCMKSFPTVSFSEKPDYGGFNRDDWKIRTHSDFLEAAMKHRHVKTAKERNEVAKKNGVCYSVVDLAIL